MNVAEIGTMRLNDARLKVPEKITSRADKKDPKLYEACQDFEAIFIKIMLNSMKKTVQKSGLQDGGMAEDIFEDMLYDKYAESMSRTAGLGIADMIYKQVGEADPA